MSRLFQTLLFLGLLALLVPGAARAASYKLEDGSSIEGEVLSTDERGVMFRLGGGDQISERIAWMKFSQEGLKELNKSPKCAKYVEPFLEVDTAKKVKRKEVAIQTWPQLERTPAGSVLGGFFGTGIGLFALFLIYAANVYSGYEIATVRAYPWPLVCGIAAVAPIVGPIVFLCMPTRIKTREQEQAEQRAADEAAAAEAAALAEASGEGGGEAVAAAAEAAPAEPQWPPTQRFPRGQFTFNRRFIETKFAGFFALVRRDAEKDMVLIVKSARGTFTVQRVARISAVDLHAQVQEGPASKEVMIPFTEIQEILLKHKDCPDT
jgi:hypothetical protein